MTGHKISLQVMLHYPGQSDDEYAADHAYG